MSVLNFLLCLAAITHYAIDPMAETMYLPDAAGFADAREGEPVRAIAARGEYEPAGFLLRSDRGIAHVDFEIGELKTKDGKVFPKANVDLKTVKVWYQDMNAWYSYFADHGAKLCPELLLNDEDLVKVDEGKKCNYARLSRPDGKYDYFWLGYPEAFRQAFSDSTVGAQSREELFSCMKPNFSDAANHKGARLEKNRFKQFHLTYNVTKDVAPGVYRGEVKVRGEGEEKKIPLVLRVLPFELPRPGCYADPTKEFKTWFCDYTSIGNIMHVNGGDEKLAEKQLVAIAADFARHGQYIPSFREAFDRPDLVRAAGQDYSVDVMPTYSMQLVEPAEIRCHARAFRKLCDERFGKDSKPYIVWGDEYGLGILRGIRPMVDEYQNLGIRFPVNSHFGYAAGAHLTDIFWPPVRPEKTSNVFTGKYHDATGGRGYFGWYANLHVGAENPAFNRRQYGMGPYRAGLSCNYNYAHHIQGWSDSSQNLYRPMMFVYGCGSGCVDTLAWEGFREGLDDIRYATLLKTTALKALDSPKRETRYTARLALKLLADADGDDMDLSALRLEMIDFLLKLEAGE